MAAPCRPPLPTPPPGVLLPPPPLDAACTATGPVATGTPAGRRLRGRRPPGPPPVAGTTYAEMSFFVTSRGSRRGGGDFRQQMGDADGLAGADALCQALATAALAPLGEQDLARLPEHRATSNARDRIGAGSLAERARHRDRRQHLEQLHEEGELTNNLVIGEFLNVLDEKGNPVDPDRHDILTGSAADGTVDPQGRTCNNWRSQSAQVQALVGHGDRQSRAAAPAGRPLLERRPRRRLWRRARRRSG